MRKSMGLRENRFYIMNAKGFIDGRKSVKAIFEANGSTNATIVVLDHDGVKKFVLGAQGVYGAVGERVPVTIDTGRGYRYSNDGTVENHIHMIEGVITSDNDVGLTEKRIVSVFK